MTEAPPPAAPPPSSYGPGPAGPGPAGYGAPGYGAGPAPGYAEPVGRRRAFGPGPMFAGMIAFLVVGIAQFLLSWDPIAKHLAAGNPEDLGKLKSTVLPDFVLYAQGQQKTAALAVGVAAAAIIAGLLAALVAVVRDSFVGSLLSGIGVGYLAVCVADFVATLVVSTSDVQGKLTGSFTFPAMHAAVLGLIVGLLTVLFRGPARRTEVV